MFNPQQEFVQEPSILSRRLSRTEHLILDLLQDREGFGLELVERSGGALKRGTVYVTLARMQDKGYVTSRTEEFRRSADRLWASRTPRVVPAAHLTTIALGALFTVISSGWIAPELIRRDLTRQHDAFGRWAAHAPSSSANGIYVPPLDFSLFQKAKPWPELIRSATESPRQQFPLMPRYVDPGEAKRPAADRQEIIDRLFLVLLAFGSGVAGGTIGGSTRGPVDVQVIDHAERRTEA
jgi:hypothetical protein